MNHLHKDYTLFNATWRKKARFYTPEKLLERFLDGEKIDINRFYQQSHKTPYIHQEPTFISQKKPFNKTHMIQEKSIVIIIDAHNNIDSYEHALESISSQDYHNYRIIYLDNASTDGTAKHVAQYIQKNGLQLHCTLLCNDRKLPKTQNLYSIIHSCKNDEIVMLIDKGGWLSANSMILKQINERYQDKQTWMTYGSYEKKISGDMPCKDITQNTKKRIRPLPVKTNEKAFIPGHPTTFYAWLFKQIELKDLLENGLFDTSYDITTIYCPLHEMARKHCTFISDILYICNKQNNTIQQKKPYKKRKPYKMIKKPINKRMDKDKTTNMILLCTDPTSNIAHIVEHICQYTQGLDKLYIVSDKPLNTITKNSILRRHNHSVCIDHNWHDQLQNHLNKCYHDYSILITDKSCIKRHIETQSLFRLFEQASAHCFYLGSSFLDKTIPVNAINDTVYAWQFSYGNSTTPAPQNVIGTLYRCSDIRKKLTEHRYSTIEQFIDAWHEKSVKKDKIGLLYMPQEVYDAQMA
jgi:glycosyltransferase involved in cell wall biosynthesis